MQPFAGAATYRREPRPGETAQPDETTMRHRPIVSLLAAAVIAAAFAAPAAADGTLDSAKQAVKSFVEKQAGTGSGHAQGAADLVKNKAGGLGKAGSLLGKDKLNLLKKKKGEP